MTYNKVYYEKIKNEWAKLTKYQNVDKKLIRPMIYDSWIRSRNNNIDPYSIDENLILTNDEVQMLLRSPVIEISNNNVEKMIKEIAVEMNVIFEVLDKNARIKKILAIPENFCSNQRKSISFRDVSESKMGTNAVNLALKEDKPVQIIGPEHFHSFFHKFNCSAAPIHDNNGEIIGAINVASSTKQTIETLGLVTSIAKILDNYTIINNMLLQLTDYNATLNEIMEYLPQGIIYMDNNKIHSFNNKLLKMLDIKGDTKNQEFLNNMVNKSIEQIELLQEKKELEQEEFVFNIGGRNKSYLISTKKIRNSQNSENGKLMIFEDKAKVLKHSLRGNSAFYTLDDIIGQHSEIKKLKTLARKIAPSSSAVLVYGENGTGKELLSQGIHNASLRKNMPFVAINCGAIPSELIESELFGYEPGAFTGALKGGKPGKLEIATGGTLFLDEIESMPLHVQIKLLRALSTKKITRIGGLKEISIDIRLISATKKDLLKEAENGYFREDLLFRINIITLNIPSLRERKEDINILVRHFINEFSKQTGISDVKTSPEFLQALNQYNWRGNVRELRNVIERAFLLLDNNKELVIAHLPERIKKAYEYRKSYIYKETKALLNRNEEKVEGGLLKAAEDMIIEHVLKEENGNLTKVAERLGISRPTLYKKMNKSTKTKMSKETLQSS